MNEEHEKVLDLVEEAMSRFASCLCKVLDPDTAADLIDELTSEASGIGTPEASSMIGAIANTLRERKDV